MRRRPKGTALRGRLWGNIARFHAGLPARWKSGTLSTSAIQPLDLRRGFGGACNWRRHLREQGFLIPAIRYPTVPRHAARLRVTLSAAHADKEIDALNEALAIN